jgi:N-carbamoyl-L-amino-acid hydrolase
MSSLSITPARLNRTLEELGRIGETPQGMQRLAFSTADVAGREYTVKLMHQAGLETRIDPAGNIIGRKEGCDPGLPAIALGSHIDTVPNGGKYDGALGVMGAIEAVQTLADHDVLLRHPIEVLVFTNEEGTRFHRWLFGSRAMAGLLEPEDLTVTDDEGVDIGRRLADIGGDLDSIEQAQRKAGELAAYLELHIEQGPELHLSGTPIGIVTGITGRAVFTVELTGIANHAGTTPMLARHDALVSASRLTLAVNRIAAEMAVCRVATVGNAQVHPNAVNVVPGRVHLGVEFRDERMESLAAAEVELRRAAIEIGATDGVDISIEKIESTPSVPIPARMQEMVAEAANRCGLAYRSLSSGAGHDAQAMAAITSPAMIFVPSIDGISHAPQEFTTPHDCTNGAAVLLDLLLLADEKL